jgi:hypothetical protein
MHVAVVQQEKLTYIFSLLPLATIIIKFSCFIILNKDSNCKQIVEDMQREYKCHSMQN